MYAVKANVGVLEYTVGSTSRPSATAVGNADQRRLIVYGYFRSGSTLTGQVFNSNPNAFYWFEPLAGVTTKFGWGGGQLQPRNYFHFDNGTEKCV